MALSNGGRVPLWLFFLLFRNRDISMRDIGKKTGNLSRFVTVIFFIILWAAAIFYFTRPVLWVMAEQETVAQVTAYQGLPIKIRFIHSVQKTPVEEYLHLEDDLQTIQLDSTIYHSFGVGLPFLETDGNWRQEGDLFILENMDRHFPSLSLRTGLGTQLTLTVDNVEYRLYEKYQPGHRIDIQVVPRYKVFFNHR